MVNVITVSGGCHSGKTTTMTKLKEAFEQMGFKVEVFKENIHKYINSTIEELRADPHKYLQVQCKVIEERIAYEHNLLVNRAEQEADIVLIDRAITDSIMYAMMYIDPRKLSGDDLLLYADLLQKANKHATLCLPLFTLIELAPLNKPCDDYTYRPKNIDSLKHIEYTSIHTLNCAFKSIIDLMPYIQGDLNRENINDFISRVINRIKLSHEAVFRFNA